MVIKWLAPFSKKLIRLKNTILVVTMTLQMTPAHGVSPPIHLQCVGNQNQLMSVNWDDYPNKLIMHELRLEMYQEQKTKWGHMLRFYHISNSGKKVAVIESDNAIKIIYAEEGHEFEVKCS